MNKKFVAIFLALGMLLSIGCSYSASSGGSGDLSGQWDMVGNTNYNFKLDLQQSGNQITGTMTSKDVSIESVETISGTISGGTIQFTREGAEVTQVYIGSVSGSTITGSFNQNGQGQYPWSATKVQGAAQISGSADTTDLTYTVRRVKKSDMEQISGSADTTDLTYTPPVLYTPPVINLKTPIIDLETYTPSLPEDNPKDFNPTGYYFDMYTTHHFIRPTPTGKMAEIQCTNSELGKKSFNPRGRIIFMKDDVSLPKNHLNETLYPGVIEPVLYFPYSRYNEIMDRLTSKPAGYFLAIAFDPKYPELGDIWGVSRLYPTEDSF